MYTFRKWNKQDNINGFDKDYWFSSNKLFEEGEVILYSRTENDMVEVIAIESELRKSYNDFKSNIEILAQLRCDSLNGQGFESVHELKICNAELKTELASAKLLLMKEGLI